MIIYPKRNVKEKQCFSKAHQIKKKEKKRKKNKQINLTKEVNYLYAETYKKY